MSQSKKLFKVLDEYIYFDTAQESQEYAKNNPGKVIIRNTEVVDKEVQKPNYKQEPMMEKTPSMILDYLNQHIISQDEAKKEIALAIYYHSLKLEHALNDDMLTNAPIMMVGPTGSGKTFIVQKACEFADVLFLHVDAASMVPEGIKGYSVSTLIQDVISLAGGSIYKASNAVVFLDEIDKLFIQEDSELNYGAKVASQLLRLLEGAMFAMEDSNYQVSTNFSAKYVQFILGGAFQPILDKKQEKKSVMGFATKPTKRYKQKITLEDLYSTNVPKELLGRMGAVVNLHPLNKEDYYKILTQSESSPLKEFINRVEFHGDTVDIDEHTLYEVAQYASKSKLGVRAIKQALKSMFSDALFYAADGEHKTHKITFKEDIL